MITAIVTSDNHLGAYYARLRPDTLEKRRRRIQQGLKQVVDAAISHHVDLFLHAGDLFDRPDPRNAERRFAAEQFQRLRAEGIGAYAIAGNHDSPRGYGYDGGIAPLEEMSAVQAVRLFRATDRWDMESVVIRGRRVCIRGLSSDFGCGPETCPLQDLAADTQRGGDVDIALLHYGVEEWGDFPGEPCLVLANLDRLGTDALCIGHLHRPNHRRLPGGALMLNPGATEHIRFGEESLDCGYWLLKCEPGHVEAEYHAIRPQPMRTLTLDLGALTDAAPPVTEGESSRSLQEALLQRIGEASENDQMLRARMTGRLARTLFPKLDLVALQEHGLKGNFHFQLDTDDLALYDELEGWHLDIGFNFDVRQELQKTVQSLRPNYAEDEGQESIHLDAGRELDAAYARLTGGLS